MIGKRKPPFNTELNFLMYWLFIISHHEMDSFYCLNYVIHFIKNSYFSKHKNIKCERHCNTISLLIDTTFYEAFPVSTCQGITFF